MKNIRYIFIVFISLLIHFKVYAVPVFVSDRDVNNGSINTPTGILFNPSGSKMYVVGFNGASDNGFIGQYSLSTPFSISSASLDEDKNITTVLKRPQDIKFNSPEFLLRSS